ncbi:DNA/RNA non-specific endonuclease [Lutibacter sp.]|uniref:DNA/RNA non-specific endonuclease n=1 Tax=Lutibacter sp. TaxID=1925666 RepID=UPI002736B5B2|nr:DNA/RNA non-specific endonuclease [Lutibacter sp.]MDP3313399.1 DNA/RNA non-specific endonuclease [Lutibacter sp.]
MENRKIIYTVITILFATGFYFYDHYYVEKKSSSNTQNNSTFNFLPTSTTKQIIHHQFYSLSYNEKYEQAEWVAYTLKKDHLKNNQFKRPFFELDPKVTTKSAHYKNYKNSGYNKGHLCPAGDRKFSEEAFNETFLTSNISPQLYDFNGGIWNRLEQKVRYWAQKYDKLYVVTGGVLNDNLKTIGSEKVAVPNYFYKIILDNTKPKIKAIAFLIPHEETEKGLYYFVTSIDEIEKLTGIDFFYDLPDEIENNIEASDNYTLWSLHK